MNKLAADGIPIAVTCGVFKLARQPYYRWLSTPVADTEIIEASCRQVRTTESSRRSLVIAACV